MVGAYVVGEVMRALAGLLLLFVVSACTFDSDTPLFGSSEGVTPFASGTVIQFSDQRYRLDLVGSGYRVTNLTQAEATAVTARVVPIGQIGQSNFSGDLLFQLGPGEEGYIYAFLIRTDSTWRLVSAPGDFRPLNFSSACLLDESSDGCTFSSRAELIRFYSSQLGRTSVSARGSYGDAATVSAPRASAPPATSGSSNDAQLLDAIVASDSRSWVMNRYQRGSMRVVSVTPQAAQGYEPPGRVVRGQYTYNGSLTGWVEVYFVGSEARSIRFHDFPSTWRRPR